MARVSQKRAGRRPPWPVVAFLPAAVAWVIAFYWVIDANAAVPRVLTGLLVPAALGIGVWRRAKLAWYLAVASNVGALALGAASFLGGNEDVGLVQFVGGGALLWLLLHGETRRWCDA